MSEVETTREKFYRELTERVRFLRNKLQPTRRDQLILGGVEALIINCNRRKALVHKNLVERQDINNLEFFLNNDFFRRVANGSNEDFITKEYTFNGEEFKVHLINHLPQCFNGVDFKFATAEFLLSDEELRYRITPDSTDPYGLSDEIIQEMKFSLSINSRLPTQQNAIHETIIPKDNLDGDYATVVLKSILAIIEPDVKTIYLKFLKMVLDTSINLSVIDNFINRNGLKESLVERVLVIRSQNLLSRMNEVIEENNVSLETI